MRKARPFIVLFLILGVPLVAIFLLDRGTHLKKELDIISPKIPSPDGGPDSLYKTVGEFAFLSQTGDTITHDSLRGFIYVADVFFTTCEGICPKLSEGLSDVHEYFKDSKDVKLLSVSVDPEADSVEALAAYAESYGADPHKWYFVTGNKSDLYEFVQQELFFSADSTMVPIAHDRTLRLIDKEGRMRGEFFDGTVKSRVDSLIDNIKVLQFEYDQDK